MPFTRIAIPAGTSSAHKAAIARGVHEAMVAAIGIPEDDFFQMLSEYKPGDFLFDRGFRGVQRTASLVIVKIPLRRGRHEAMKLYHTALLTANLDQAACISPPDLSVYLRANNIPSSLDGSRRMNY